MTDRPITLPPGLVQQWRHKWTAGHGEFGVYLATQAARWGADQELEAIRQLIEINGCSREFIDFIINARRPKPLSLKAQALAVLDDCSDRLDAAHENTIRRALEAMTDD